MTDPETEPATDASIADAGPPADTVPADAPPVDVPPADVPYGEPDPVDVAPDEPNLADVAPVDVAPADAAPPDVTPADAPPVEASPVEAASATPPAPVPAPASGPPWKVISAILAVVLLAVGAYVVFGGDDDDGGSAAPATTTTLATGEFIAVEDEAAGFSIEYPKTWKPIRPADGEERLLLTAGGQNYFQLKVRTVDPATVDQEVQTALEGLQMITEPRQLTLNGLPATLYLYYTPITESSPEQGVHVHYFILKGERLYSMVFQALPSENLNDLVPVFDRVAKSFKISGTPATTPTTTTATTTG